MTAMIKILIRIEAPFTLEDYAALVQLASMVFMIGTGEIPPTPDEMAAGIGQVVTAERQVHPMPQPCGATKGTGRICVAEAGHTGRHRFSPVAALH